MTASTTGGTLPSGPSPSETTAPERVPSLRQEPGKVEVRLTKLESLFDHASPPSYPHTGSMVERSVAKFLLDATREQRRRPEVELVLALEGPPLSAGAEADTRVQVRRFFANEAELATLEERVNRAEGLGSIRYSIPLVLVALLVAGLFYSQVGALTGAGFFEALTYLIFITVVWVLLWDPLEVLLFDSYIIRQRVRALRKLSRARVTFAYRPPAVP